MSSKVFVSYVIAVSFVLSSCVSTSGSREVAGLFGIQSISPIFSQRGAPKSFSDSEVAKIASVANLSLQDARLIQDNDAAFESKLAMIEKAQREIRMVYFIYADDDSSSVISNALIKKAKSGVQVKLLVDFITNYSKFDLLRMMENEGNGNLSVYYYNFPGKTILEDAKYMTLPCPTKNASPTANECAQYKKPLMAQLAGQEATPFSKMLLTGMYGKNTTALKVALGYGAQINPEDYKTAKATSAEDRGQIFQFFKLMKQASTGDLSAKIKLAMAMKAHGETLNPIMNETTGRFPFLNQTTDAGVKHSAAWDHLTDYTHHKLLIVDGFEFQLGGRNIEDSYHMKSRIKVSGREDKGKYIFMDTDFWGQAKSQGDLLQIEATFDKLINFKEMVVNSQRVGQIMPNEFIRNTARIKADAPSPGEMAVGMCLQKAKAGAVTDLGGCIEASLPQMPGYQSLNARIEAAKKAMLVSESNFKTNYRSSLSENFRDQAWSNGIDHLTAQDLQKAKISYIENINYGKKNSAERIIGSRLGFEADYNKNIHSVWYRGLENVCQVSRNENRNVRVILHNAYLFMPSGMMVRLAKMLNGDYGDCSKVRITFLTNSIPTTDLNVINIFARHQLRALMTRAASAKAYADNFKLQNGRKYEEPPVIEYYEYNPTNAGVGRSLHTKLSLIDQDMIVGSANADVRSYFMDTNNGVFIRGATELNDSYVKHIDSIISDPRKASAGMLTEQGVLKFEQMSDQMIQMQDRAIVDGLLNRWDKKGRIRIVGGESSAVLAKKKNQQAIILQELADIGKRITDDSNALLQFRQELNSTEQGSSSSKKIEERLNQIANDFDDYFKLL